MSVSHRGIDERYYLEGKNQYANVRDCLNAMEAKGVCFAYHGVGIGGDFRQEYRFGDMDILLEYEDLDFTDDEEIDANGDRLIFAKPNMVIYGQYQLDTTNKIRGTLLMEWQIIVNTANHGRLNLDGYSQLCQSIFDHDDVGQPAQQETWSEFGLLPRWFQLTKIRDGSSIAPELQARIMQRSILCSISIL